MSDDPLIPFRYRTSQVYGWPFYMVRKALRGVAGSALRAADALSGREKYTCPVFFKPLLPANARLKDACRGRRGFIVGNGPSLNSQDLSALNGEVTFAMNGFVNHPLIASFQPSYYCIADPAYFDGSAPSTKFLDRIVAQVKTSQLVIPCTAAEELIGRRRVPADRATLVAFCGNLTNSRLKRIDLTRPIPNVNNCAELALLVALYVGCSPIYLLGMDHDWLAHRGRDTHFYPGQTLPNHTYAHGEFWRKPYGLIMENALKLWRGYENLQRYAAQRGIQIINCTEGGFLDVFQRARLADVLAGAPRRAVAA